MWPLTNPAGNLRDDVILSRRGPDPCPGCSEELTYRKIHRVFIPLNSMKQDEGSGPDPGRETEAPCVRPAGRRPRGVSPARPPRSLMAPRARPKTMSARSVFLAGI